MQFLTGTLEPTRTYASRSYVWVGGLAPETCDGVLTVQFVHGKTARAKVESRRYILQEQPPDAGCRLFFFLKVDPPRRPGEPEPEPERVGDERPERDRGLYEVRCLPGGGVTCTCKAASCRLDVCVHRDVIPELIAAGAFPDPDPAPNEVSGSWFEPDPPPPQDDDLPACFQGIGGSPDRAPF